MTKEKRWLKEWGAERDCCVLRPHASLPFCLCPLSNATALCPCCLALPPHLLHLSSAFFPALWTTVINHFSGPASWLNLYWALSPRPRPLFTSFSPWVTASPLLRPWGWCSNSTKVSTGAHYSEKIGPRKHFLEFWNYPSVCLPVCFIFIVLQKVFLS